MEKLRKFSESLRGGRWIWFRPLRTRGLKFLIPKTSEPQVARVEELIVFTELGESPPPKIQRPTEHPTFPIHYELEQDGKFTMVIDDARGFRVRNLLAPVERKKGPNTEYWDLKDDSGSYVRRGIYKREAITHPGLKLRYQMTAYPNVTTSTPENSAWLNGHSRPGGWLVDHTPARAVCTAGKGVYFCSPCAESGVSFIECDLTGRKLWGYHSFAAWTGPELLATDGKSVFVFSQPHSLKGTEGIWAVDIETKEVRELFRRDSTSTRHRGIKGIEARDGKLYLSVKGDSRWLRRCGHSKLPPAIRRAPQGTRPPRTGARPS